MKRRFECKIEPRDLWVGVFWDRRPELHVYVCPLPTVLLHWWWPVTHHNSAKRA